MNKAVIIFALIVIALGIVSVYGVPYKTIVDGSHTGVITSVETTGIIFKTTTVYVKTDPMSSQEDKYCLIDKSLIPTLKKYEYNKTLVTVKYDKYLLMGYKDCDKEEGGIITDVVQ